MRRRRWNPGRARLALVSLSIVAVGVALVASIAGAGAAPPRLPLPPDRQRLVDARAAQDAARFATATAVNVRPRTGPVPTWPPGPTATPVLGIQEVDWQTRLASTMSVTNRWGGYFGDDYLDVYAGSKTPKFDVAILAVTRRPIRATSADRERTQFYVVPTGVASVTIIAVSDTNRLTLRGKDGSTIVFDLASMSFVGYPDAATTPTRVPNRVPQTRTVPPTRWAATPTPRAATRTPGPVQRPADGDAMPHLNE